MKKSRMIAMLTVISMSFILSAAAVDTENPGKVRLSLESGRLVESSPTVESLQETIDDYFAVHTAAVNEHRSAVAPMMAAVVDSTTAIANDALLRADSLKSFWADEGIDIVSADNTAAILNAEISTFSNAADITVYEWTWVYYNNGDGADSPATDRFGFATIHDMTASMASDGTYRITRDDYDEADISGFTSSGYDEKRLIQVTAAVDPSAAFADVLADLDSTQVNPAAVTANTGGFPDVWACIDWANTHVIKDISSSTSPNTQYYDLSYGSFGQKDCANFVSQCLFAGGFTMDSTWYNYLPSDGSYSAAWAGSISMQSYWGPKYGNVVSSDQGLYPGNPVFLEDDSHVAIVVGYNTAGRAIINGHTRDVYHQPISDSYSKTIQINKSTSMVNKPNYATQFPSIPYTYPQTLKINAGQGEWFKFTPTSNGYYSIHSTGNTDTVGYLYTGTDIAGHNPKDPAHNYVQLMEIYYNDDSLVTSDGKNCRVGEFLNAGTTYYFMIRGKTPTTTGNYGLVLLKET